MTLLGLIVEPGRVVAWQDTEAFGRDGRPDGEFLKLSVSAVGLVAAGTGSVPIIRCAGSVLQSELDIDAIERQMPGKLRRRAAELAAGKVIENESWCAREVVVAAGFSPSARRMVGWRFTGAGFFAAVLASRIAMPTNDLIEGRLASICGLTDVLRVARQQIAALRQNGCEDATGGTLTVAELTPDEVHCWKFPEFDLRVATSLQPDAPSTSAPETILADVIPLAARP